MTKTEFKKLMALFESNNAQRSEQDGMVVFRGDDFCWRLNKDLVDSFVERVSAGSKEALEVLKLVGRAIGKDGSRANLHRMHAIAAPHDKGFVRVMATDGHRLHWRDVPVEVVEPGLYNDVGERQVATEDDARSPLTWSICDEMSPVGGDAKHWVDGETLLRFCKLARKQKCEGITIDAKGMKGYRYHWVVNGRGKRDWKAYGEHEVEMAVDFVGGPPDKKYMFNPKYMQEAIERNGNVVVRWSGPHDVILVLGDKFNALVMPMRDA